MSPIAGGASTWRRGKYVCQLVAWNDHAVGLAVADGLTIAKDLHQKRIMMVVRGFAQYVAAIVCCTQVQLSAKDPPTDSKPDAPPSILC